MRRYAHALSGFAYLLFFLLLLKWIAFGSLSHYVAPRMSYFVYACDVFFLGMALFQFYRAFGSSPAAPSCACHSHTASPRKTLYLHGILFVPLILGFGFPEKTLDGAVAEKRIIAVRPPAAVQAALPLAAKAPQAANDETASRPKMPTAATSGSNTAASSAKKSGPSGKTAADAGQTAPKEAEPQKGRPADKSEPAKKPEKKAPAPSSGTPAPRKQAPSETSGGSSAARRPAAQPAAAVSGTAPGAAPGTAPGTASGTAPGTAPGIAPGAASADDNGGTDMTKFSQKEIAVMQMRMGLGNDSSSSSDSSATESAEAKPDKIVLTDDNFATTMGEIFANPAAYTGNVLELTGFVLHTKELPLDEAFIVRYVITCCIADATPTYAIAKGDELKNLKDDTWVAVTGTIAQNPVPKWSYSPFMNVSAIRKVKAPEDPYAYY